MMLKDTSVVSKSKKMSAGSVRIVNQLGYAANCGDCGKRSGTG